MFEDDSISSAEVCWWHKEFKNDRENVTDVPRCGREVEVRTDDNAWRVRVLVHQGRRVTVRVLADELDINRKTVRKIFS